MDLLNQQTVLTLQLRIQSEDAATKPDGPRAVSHWAS